MDPGSLQHAFFNAKLTLNVRLTHDDLESTRAPNYYVSVSNEIVWSPAHLVPTFNRRQSEVTFQAVRGNWSQLDWYLVFLQ